MIITIISVI